MRKFKMFTVLILAMVMSMSVSLIAFAAGSAAGKEVDGYDFLFGSIAAIDSVAEGKAYIHAPTSIKTNPDNAYLRVKIELQNSKGKVLDSGIQTSERGVDYLMGYFLLGSDLDLTSFNDVHVAYGAHNVQGGRTYSAQVVYTVTTQIQ